MDSIEKNIIRGTLLFLSLFVFGIIFSIENTDINLPECIPNAKPFTESKIEPLGGNLFQVFYVAKMWTFDPKVIRVPAGSKLEFYLSAKDVVHGFNIRNTNINLMAIPGSVNKFSHTFRERGVYEVICHEYCGTGHQNMFGQIIVQ